MQCLIITFDFSSSPPSSLFLDLFLKDHTGGNKALKKAYPQCKVIGPEGERYQNNTHKNKTKRRVNMKKEDGVGGLLQTECFD